jgi:Ca2+-binding EF-hand superfamily protein
MARFFKKFMGDPLDATIAQMVEDIWYEYDVDRSGWLDKRETLVFLKDFLNENNQAAPTVIAYNKWFAEFDLNGNGTIEKGEMAAFVRKFFTRS